MSGGTDRLLGAIGLCRRARKLICGTPLICAELHKGGSVCAVLAASDASENTKKKLKDKCKFYGVWLYLLPYTAEQLARAVGKDAPISAVAVTDAQMYKAVQAGMSEKECQVLNGNTTL